jgi:hypothetical protein
MKKNLKIKLAFAIILALLWQQGGISVASVKQNQSSQQQAASASQKASSFLVVVTQAASFPATVSVAANFKAAATCLTQPVISSEVFNVIQNPSPINLNEPASCFSLAVGQPHFANQPLQVYSRPQGQLPQVAVNHLPLQTLVAVAEALPQSSPVFPIIPFVFLVIFVEEFGDRFIKPSKKTNLTFQRFKIFTVFELGNMRC